VSGPRTGWPCFVGRFVVLPAVVLYACGGLCLTRRRLPARGGGEGKGEGQSQLRLRRARLRERRGTRSACGWSVLGVWWSGSGWGVLLACPRRQSGTCRGRNRRWAGLAVARRGLRRLRPRQNPDRATPARRGEHPNLSGKYCASLNQKPAPPGHRCKILPQTPANFYAVQAYYENEQPRPRVPRKTLQLSFPEPTRTTPFVSAPR
jgi:hypothetical protein